MSFIRRPLSKEPARLGEKLRTLRRSQMLTLDMLASRTQINLKYLRALEEGDFSELSAPLYTRNFVRAYVRSLSGDERYFLELFESEVAQSDLLDPHRLPRERVRKKAFNAINNWWRVVSLSLLGLTVIGFFGWQGYRVVVPPTVVLEAPVEDGVVSEAQYLVRGTLMDGEAELYVNNILVTPDREGLFSQLVVLSEGPNQVTIKAARRFSLVNLKTFVLVYTPVGILRQ